VVKLGLAAVVSVLAAGGLIAGFNADASPPTPEPPSLPSPHRPIALAAPAPRAAEPKQWIPVTGRVVFPAKRDIPVPRPMPVALGKDRDFFGMVTAGDVVIDPKTRGIANALVWLRPDSDDRRAPFPVERIHPELLAAKPMERVVTLGRDGFSPRVIAARAGDRLVFTNPTPIPFNVRYQTPESADGVSEDGSHNFNVLLPADQSYTSKPLPVVQSPDIIQDGIHHWLRAYARTFDHPYFAVTDAEGRFEFADAPTGTWRLVVWHEKVGYLGGMKGRLGERVTITPDGKVELPPLVLNGPGWNEN
jgi:hypothetical protein